MYALYKRPDESRKIATKQARRRACRRVTLKFYSNMEVLHYDTLHHNPKGRNF